MGKGRRYRYKYYKSKGRWSANLTEVQNQIYSFTGSAISRIQFDLCTNPAQSNTTVSQQYTVKNVYFNFQLECSADQIDYLNSLTGYIMYVPQGMDVGQNYPKQHPEYIMAMRFFGTPESRGSNTQGLRNPLSIRTRLARRLQTGDKIIFLLIGINSNSSSVSINLNGILRWWTKAN